MSRIVEDLIDVSRVVEKKVELKTTRLNLADPIHAAIETCRSYVESCRHQIIAFAASRSAGIRRRSGTIDAGPASIRLITQRNTPSQAASFASTAEPGRSRLDRLADQGYRYRNRRLALPHIFEMFTQGRGAPDHGRGGLGVGLRFGPQPGSCTTELLRHLATAPARESEFLMCFPAAKRRLPLPEKTPPRLAPWRSELYHHAASW